MASAYDTFIKDIAKDGLSFRDNKTAIDDAQKGVQQIVATTSRKFAVAVESSVLPVSTSRKVDDSPKFRDAFRAFRFKSGESNETSDNSLQSRFKAISVAALHRMKADRKFSATLDLVAARVAALKLARDTGTDKNAPAPRSLLEAYYTAATIQNEHADRDLTEEEINNAAKKPAKNKKLADMLKTVANSFKPLVGDKKPDFVDATTLAKLNEALEIVNGLAELADPEVAAKMNAKDAEIAALKAQLAKAAAPAKNGRREKATV